jgi:hypothetical protein
VLFWFELVTMGGFITESSAVCSKPSAWPSSWAKSATRALSVAELIRLESAVIVPPEVVLPIWRPLA